MKKIMFALCFMFGGIVVVNAQETQDTTSNQYRTETQSQYPQDQSTQLGQDRQRIQVTELPDEVKRSLEADEYRGWLVSGAFTAQQGADQSLGADTTSTDPTRQDNANATGTEDQEIYIVELKNGAETKTIHFDKDGQKIEGMEGDQNNQNSPGNQYNQNDQMDQTTPADPSVPADPSTPADPNATEPADPNATDQPDQSQSEQTPSTPSPSDQSTGTPSEQSTPPSPGTETQTDQSKVNEPK